jgi:hypothetical protein
MDPRNTEGEKANLGASGREIIAGTQLFRRFTLQKVLGCGGMSVVWLAHDDGFERLVALKLVPESAVFDPTACEDLKRATHQSLPLMHANIVRIFDFIADEGMAAISMEYVDGDPLSCARIQKRSQCFGLPEVVPWITSLCDALDFAHESAGLIHGGLRPANMMLNSRAHLKITDFGIASSLRNSMRRANLSVPGETVHYLSPQQMLGEDPSPLDDIYALGVTLYEMLSSKPPFYDSDVGAQVGEVIAPPINQRRVTLGIAGERIPRHWEETITACLAKQPDQRPRSAAEVASRLRLGGTVRLTVAREVARPVFHRYLKLGALTAGVAALVAAALFYRSYSMGQRAAVLSALEKESPAGYALEAPIKKTSAPQNQETRSATLQLSTSPPGATFAIYPGLIIFVEIICRVDQHLVFAVPIQVHAQNLRDLHLRIANAAGLQEIAHRIDIALLAIRGLRGRAFQGALRAITPSFGVDGSDTFSMSEHTSASADFGLPPVALPTSWVSPKTRKAVRPFMDLAAFSALIHLPLALPPNK